MKKNIIAALTVALVAVLATGCAVFAKEKSEAELLKDAKISKEAATKTALTKAPGGTVKESELEEEDGKLVWSFDIAVPGEKDITEVQVDAKTGEILSVEKESPEDQKKEADEDNDKKK